MANLALQLPLVTPAEPHLLKIPIEIRETILAYVFGEHDLYYWLSLPEKRGSSYVLSKKGKRSEQYSHLAIVKTCKLLFHEGLEVYRRSTKFVYEEGKDGNDTFDKFLRKNSFLLRSKIVHVNCLYSPPTNMRHCIMQMCRLRSFHVFVMINDHDDRTHWTKQQLRSATTKDFEALLLANEFDVRPLSGLRSHEGKAEMTVGFETPYYPLPNRRVRTIVSVCSSCTPVVSGY